MYGKDAGVWDRREKDVYFWVRVRHVYGRVISAEGKSTNQIHILKPPQDYLSSNLTDPLLYLIYNWLS